MNDYFNKLTKGAIGHILEGAKIEDPVLQMLAYKNMPVDNNKRFRLVLSDGAYTYQCCIIMGDLALKVENGDFDRYCLLKVSRYMLSDIQGRQVIVLADPKLFVKGTVINEKLGEPVPYGSAGAPPLSNFKPNYHINSQNEMDVEFDEDPFSDTDSKTKISDSNASKKMKNDHGQARDRSYASSSNTSNQLNALLACPISSLTPYSNKWLIKGRCLAKTGKRSWNNSRGEGYLFSFDLQDNTSDIRLTAFKTECDKFFDLIKVDKVYLVSKGVIKQANKQFTRTTSEYEISINSDTIIELCEDISNCPTITFNLVPLNELSNHFGGFVDVIGIIKSIKDVETVIQKKKNKEMIKRDLIIVDQTRNEVALTTWGDLASNFTGEVEDVVCVRGCKVSEFNGISLSLTSNSTFKINPELDEVMELKGWYSRVKDNLETNSLTNKQPSGFLAKWSNLSEINQENIQRETTVTLQTKGTIFQMGKANMYKACSCNKKLLDLNNGFYRCDKCQTETDKFDWKILISFSISDHTKNIWVQAFHEEAIKILNIKDLDTLGNLLETNQSQFDDILRSATFHSYIFKLRARMEHFNDDARIRTQVLGVSQINHRTYGEHLLEAIRGL